jgi:hypothetical protein
MKAPRDRDVWLKDQYMEIRDRYLQYPYQPVTGLTLKFYLCKSVAWFNGWAHAAVAVTRTQQAAWQFCFLGNRA